ncbi:MAG: 50S ribosomal protein L2 [Nanoarchaeota archaeon]
MGKRIIIRRRGRGTPVYRARSNHFLAEVKYRKFDQFEKSGKITGKVVDLVKCPGHTTPLAKIKFENNEEAFMLAPSNLRVNDKIESGLLSSLNNGNTLPLKQIPEGTLVYNIESFPGDGGKFCRAAGNCAKIISITRNSILVELPSKKQRKFLPDCRATIGTLSGHGRKDKPFVKAGKRWHYMRARGKVYPQTSAVAMNALNHPYGSGRGRKHAKIKVVSRDAPPGRKVGKVAARRTGRK